VRLPEAVPQSQIEGAPLSRHRIACLSRKGDHGAVRLPEGETNGAGSCGDEGNTDDPP